MRRLDASEVHALQMAHLGLDPGKLEFTSVEVIAALLRRAAGLLCPCPPSTLVRGVVDPLRGLVEDLASVQIMAQDTLETMIGHGDLLENCDIEEDSDFGTATLLFSAPLSFVSRDGGSTILLGIPSSQSSGIPPELAGRIEHNGHVRRLYSVQGEDLATELRQMGYIEIPSNQWLQVPPRHAPEQHIDRMDRLLNSSGPSGDVPGLTLLDWASPVRYYRGRWTSPSSQNGRFVARRSQLFGADLWCYIEMRDGRPQRVVDLPIGGSRWRGCDEAWHLQMAIDAQREEAQQFRVVPGPEGNGTMQFFSPVPMWAQRRLDAIGEKVSVPGCLFAYRLGKVDMPEEMRFVRNYLWLEELEYSPG